MVIIGASLGARDYSFRTNSIRVVNTNRKVLYYSRVLFIFLCSLALLLVHLFLGLVYDFLAKDLEEFSIKFALKILCILILVFLWGIISYTIAFLTCSYVISVSAVLGYFLADGIFARIIPESILKIFPIWNQKTVLHYYFPVPEGMVAVIQKTYGEFSISLLILLTYLVFLLVLSYILNLKREYR